MIAAPETTFSTLAAPKGSADLPKAAASATDSTLCENGNFATSADLCRAGDCPGVLDPRKGLRCATGSQCEVAEP
jgi:hypothetical protein